MKETRRWSELRFGEKLGEGHFRECYAIEGEPGLCVKRIKPDLGFMQRLQLQVLRRGLNREEYATFQLLPEELKPFFSPVIDFNEEFIITPRPADYNGHYSLALYEYGPVANESFWKDIEKVVKLLDQHNMWFFDAFQLGKNIFVQKTTEQVWKPVIVDYKRLGWKSYPVQLNLLLNSEKKKKFYRRYRRFEDKFRKS